MRVLTGVQAPLTSQAKPDLQCPAIQPDLLPNIAFVNASRSDNMIEIIANYKVIATLCESTLLSLIYRVEQINLVGNLPKQGVLKLLKSEYPASSEIEQIQKEFEFIGHFKSDFIIQAYEFGFHNNRPFIFIEDFNAISIADYLKQINSLPLQDFFLIALSVAQGIEDIHNKNLIHKDINPSNILINHDHKIIKIIDFGLATKLSREHPTLKNPTHLEGTLAYISPEQTGRMNRTLDYRSDFYSLGITFYEMLTGNKPFENDDKLELLHAHLTKEAIAPHLVNPSIPVCLSQMVMKLMAKQAEHRYQSAGSIKHDLEIIKNNLDNDQFLDDFKIAYQDISNKFQIVQKLYGRERQTDILLTTFNEVAKGNSQLLLIAGYSGIGKTSLVQEIYKPITEKKGYFIAGKFDQLQHNKPYGALIQAMQSLLQQILSENELTLKKWQQNLQLALGDNGQLIIEILPMLELIIGKQPIPAALPPQETQYRFNFTFQNFIRACCNEEHLLTLFIDDLQWIDSATLKLLPVIMNDIPYLLLIGSYRDNEVDDAHPLVSMLKKLQENKINISKITLAPLELYHIKQLLSDSLYRTLDEVHSLAELLLKKSDGNPFFMGEFLRTLYCEELLNFNHSWQWDIDKIEQKNITDNVVELLVNKIYRLPDNSQTLLKLAAVFGNIVDLELIAISAEINLEKVKQNLWFCLEEGLLIMLSDRIYKFVHDRVQQAAYSLIEEQHRPALHLKTGRLLKTKLSADELAEQLLTVVDHLNSGIDLLGDNLAEKKELAQLNIESGQRAKKANAYAVAFSYFKTALSLHQKSNWQDDYSLMLSLHEELAASAFLCGEFENGLYYIDELFNHANTTLDKINAAEIKINILCAQFCYAESIHFAIELLKELDFYCPENPSEQQVDILFYDTTQVLKEKITSILALPTLEDPNQLAILRILSQILGAAYISLPSLFLWASATMTSINLTRGLCSFSPFIFGSYAIFLNHRQELEFCYLLGDIVVKMAEKPNFSILKARVYFGIAFSAVHVKKHLNNSFFLFDQAIENSLKEGDTEYFAYATFNNNFYQFYSSSELIPLKDDVKNNYHALHKVKQTGIALWESLIWQTVINLTEISATPICLEGVVDSENDVIEFFTKNNIKNGLSIFYQLKVALIVFFGESSDAIDILKKAEQHVYSRKGFIELQMLLFYGSLIYLRTCTANNPEKTNYLNHAKTNQADLKIWALHAPMNFQHKYDLVAAEIARIEGDFPTAARFYEKAIQGAHENGYLNDEALSYELAAEYYLCRNLERIAQTYLIEARFVYQRWGALAKVAQLEKKYPFLQAKKYNINISANASTSFSIQQTEQLDVLSIIKASQSIAGEIKLERLLQELLKILLANAGASRGVILLPEKEQWLVQADSDNPDSIELISSPLGDYASLPTVLINYVIRTQEKLLIDKLNSNQLNKDVYFTENPPLSLLCLPLIQQHRISGILYLENKLLSHAFTAERIKLLEILSGQIIISIENTLLYRSLEHKVMERTSELNSTISELKIAKNKLSEMAYKDSLTMLYNRRGLDYTLQDNNIFTRPLTIIICDIDHFKLINDRYGHSVGDVVIQTFARIIIEITRKTDICVRWGGEEFLILLPLTNEAEAFIVAEKIRVSCEQHLFSGLQGLCFTSSFGICSKKDDHSLDEIIHDADQALYQAKSQGRNQVCIFN